MKCIANNITYPDSVTPRRCLLCSPLLVVVVVVAVVVVPRLDAPSASPPRLSYLSPIISLRQSSSPLLVSRDTGYSISTAVETHTTTPRPSKPLQASIRVHFSFMMPGLLTLRAAWYSSLFPRLFLRSRAEEGQGAATVPGLHRKGVLEFPAAALSRPKGAPRCGLGYYTPRPPPPPPPLLLTLPPNKQ
ncbi:hypothetical protein E2C01_088817 [Portunus trituberculatus]|uniref:Uncharacterized protein n=1 Tax=Portunus trituberculatus TaxID=210409 RepID=A0A5B7JFP5_PORTR|nr:hypothetical protein [Portunus trituberculatus]